MAVCFQKAVERMEENLMLLDDFGKVCVFKEKTRTPDGEGGYYIEWTDGSEFTAYQSLDTSMEARTAEKQGITSVYSALVDKAVPIEYGDYFKEKESGTVYRVTSHPDEKQAPKSASFDLKFFTAERAVLPT